MTRAQAIEQLMQSGRGQHALRLMLNWLELNGLGLDVHNQNAVIFLLREAWGSEPRSTLDEIREAIPPRDEDLRCPPHAVSTTLHFDPNGFDDEQCVGCGLPKACHVRKGGVS